VSAGLKEIVVITGMSGSGKSTAIRALEDGGYFCVDNLPALLLPKLAELAGMGENIARLAVVMDARDRQYLKDAPRALQDLRAAQHPVQILFLDSSDEVLTRRFSETRRRHPLAQDGTVAEGIAKEREALRDLRALADHLIDTSILNVHELKRVVQARFATAPALTPTLSVMSFGYRYGVPPQADLVLDVRFLPNPYFVPELKALTGKDPQVAKFVVDRPDSQAFLEKITDLCSFLFPRYQLEGKAYLTLALGCTGGKHRSVAMAHELARRLSSDVLQVQVWDRDVEKE
jgi:UPF0042 nucleotide-binding protein